MNSLVSGQTLDIGGHRISLAAGRVVTETGVPPSAGDGVGRALAALVDPTIGPDAAERAITVDQTNTSVIVDERLIVKIVSELGSADRSAHILERLARAGSTDVERLCGVVVWEHPSVGASRPGASTLAIVTEYLPGAEDGWTWAVDDVLAHLGGAPAPQWPAIIGAVTARLHGVLGGESGAETPDAAVLRHTRAETMLREATVSATGDLGIRLRNRVDAIRAAIATLADSAPGWVFPIHGDLHVGQVLRSTGDEDVHRYTVIDFDGDPGLSALDRARPDAAARDVAHFRVSIDLVASVVQKRLQHRDDRVTAWADRAREEFLNAYLEALPDARLIDVGLLPGFEAEQLVTELLYADRFLPRWKYAPDAAIEHRFASIHSASDTFEQETPWTPPPLDPTSS